MMLNEGFIAPNINVEQFCEEASGLHINKETVSKKIRSVMSNSFGFGGTNASLILTK